MTTPNSDTNKDSNLVGMVEAIVNENPHLEILDSIDAIKKQRKDDYNDIWQLHKIVYELRGRLDAVDDLRREIAYLNKFVISLDAEKADNEHQHDEDAWFVDHDHDDDYSSTDHDHDDTYCETGHYHDITCGDSYN